MKTCILHRRTNVGGGLMKRYFRLLWLNLRIWYYRRWFDNTVQRLIYKRNMHPNDALQNALELFEWHFYKSYKDLVSPLLAEHSSLRSGSAPQQRNQAETESEPQT